MHKIATNRFLRTHMLPLIDEVSTKQLYPASKEPNNIFWKTMLYPLAELRATTIIYSFIDKKPMYMFIDTIVIE